MKNLMAQKIALGAAQFGMNYGIANDTGQVSSNEIEAILLLAKKAGIETIDTAFMYGDSEKVLGEMKTDGFKIISKMPTNTSANNIEKVLNKTLDNLKCETVHGYLFHNSEGLLGKNGDRNYSSLLQEKERGRIEKIGASAYDSKEVELLLDRYDLDIIQAPFNIIDRRLIESNILERVCKTNTELHVRSIFLQGLLLIDKNSRPVKFNHWKDLWFNWDEWLCESKMSPLEACINYVLSFDEISKIIVGVDSSQQLMEILQAISFESFAIPDEITTNDLTLLNPFNWSKF